MVSRGRSVRMTGAVFFLLFCLSPASALDFVEPQTNYNVSCTTEPKQPERDDDITLRCRLDPSVNLLDHNFDISRADIDNVHVHAYRDGEDLVDPQASCYRDRTTLVHEDLQRGTITLNISSVQLNDSGQYKLLVRALNVDHDINITVAEKGRGLGTTTRTEAPRTRETPDAEPQRKHHAAIVGGVVGGVAAVLGVLTLVIVGVLVKLGKINLSSVSTAARSWWGVLYKHGSQRGYAAGTKESEV